MSGLHKDRLIFDPADLAESDSMGAYVRAGDDGTLIGHVSDALKVNLTNASIVVTATDLDIRDLQFATDSVDVSGSSNVAVTDGGGSLTVDATDLDIRDLTHVALQDSVAIGDGTEIWQISAAGEGLVKESNLVDLKKLEDDAHASGDAGIMALAVRNDADAALTSADGDYSPIAVDSAGRLKVIADLDVDFDYVYAEDSAASSGDQLAAVAAVRQDTLASSVSADGDYGTLKLNADGALWTAPVGNVADDAADTGNPIKIGSKTKSGALAAVSATGDRADLLSDMYRRIFIHDAPQRAAASVTVSVDNVAEVALPTTALAGRTRMMIQNLGSNDIYVGPTGVTASTGFRVAKGSTLALEVGDAVALYGIGTSASASDVRVFELA